MALQSLHSLRCPSFVRVDGASSLKRSHSEDKEKKLYTRRIGSETRGRRAPDESLRSTKARTKLRMCRTAFWPRNHTMPTSVPAPEQREPMRYPAHEVETMLMSDKKVPKCKCDDATYEKQTQLLEQEERLLFEASARPMGRPQWVEVP